tara:strand:+ start:221 stop:601 length:381 start_codon:yes stop_codon:yes gene_type:complete
MARKHVVYVDDNLDLTRLVEAELQDAGYEITIANDGEEGLETILSIQPDMVILDVMMPLMNGWEVCKYLREQERFKELPILMLTGIGAVVNDMTSPLYGASDHLDKPFDMEDLIERVDTLLAKAEL